MRDPLVKSPNARCSIKTLSTSPGTDIGFLPNKTSSHPPRAARLSLQYPQASLHEISAESTCRQFFNLGLAPQCVAYVVMSNTDRGSQERVGD